MEVHFDLPDELARRIEYIPKHVLPEALLNVFRAGIVELAGSCKAGQQVKGTTDQELSEVVGLLMEAVKAAQDSTVAPVSLETLQSKPQVSEVKIKPVVQVEDDDDDLGELLGLMK